jgi:hypothetical protein
VLGAGALVLVEGTEHCPSMTIWPGAQAIVLDRRERSRAHL